MQTRRGSEDADKGVASNARSKGITPLIPSGMFLSQAFIRLRDDSVPEVTTSPAACVKAHAAVSVYV